MPSYFLYLFIYYCNCLSHKSQTLIFYVPNWEVSLILNIHGWLRGRCLNLPPQKSVWFLTSCQTHEINPGLVLKNGLVHYFPGLKCKTKSLIHQPWTNSPTFLRFWTQIMALESIKYIKSNTFGTKISHKSSWNLVDGWSTHLKHMRIGSFPQGLAWTCFFKTTIYRIPSFFSLPCMFYDFLLSFFPDYLFKK